MRTKILSYNLFLYPERDGGHYELLLEGDKDVFISKKVSLQQFSAIATLLSINKNLLFDKARKQFVIQGFGSSDLPEEPENPVATDA